MARINHFEIKDYTFSCIVERTENVEIFFGVRPFRSEGSLDPEAIEAV